MPKLATVFSITIDPTLVPQDAIGPLLDALNDYSPVLEMFRRTMLAYEMQNFATQGQTFGDPWRPLSSRTLAQKRAQGYPSTPLVRTGALQSAIGTAVHMTAESVSVGLPDEPAYFGYQNNWRVMLAISPAEINELLDALRRFIAQATGGDVAGVGVQLAH